MLKFRDSRFLSQPNAALDEDDCRLQMTVKALLRVLSLRHVKRERRNGPFLLQMTDLHASNIFVDEKWNVTGLIDLEWICALPSEMLEVSYWLTGCSKSMEDMWLSKGTWFWYCLSSVNAMYILLGTHFCPSGSLSVNFLRVMARFWCRSAEEVIQKKLADRRAYEDELRNLFRSE